MPRTQFSLRDLRDRAMLTQRELAERLGVDQRRIHEWETGKAKPRQVNRRKLCDALGVSANDLMDALEVTWSKTRPGSTSETGS